MHYELQIFKTSEDLLKVVLEIVRNFPRDYKRNTGDRLIDRCEDICELIRQANSTRGDRMPFRTKIVENLERNKTLLRALHQRGAVRSGPWYETARLSTLLGKQVYGWIK